MNFISHYYLDGFEGRVYYNLGLILPDLLVIHKRSWRLYNNMNHLPDAPDPLHSIMEGCKRHILTDSLFHNSEFFKSNCANIKQILLRNNINSPPFRLFFIAHVLLELILDKIIIERNKILVDKFYDNLESVDINVVISFLNKVKINPNEKFIDFYNNFVTNKYLYDYKDVHFVVLVLNRVLSRAKVKQSGEAYYRKFLDSALEIKELLKISYLDAFKELNSLRKKD